MTTSMQNLIQQLLRKDLTQATQRIEVDLEKNTEFRIKWPRTFGMFYRYISDELDLTNVRTLAKCETNKVTGIDNARIRRQTFTIDEYNCRELWPLRLQKRNNNLQMMNTLIVYLQSNIFYLQLIVE